MKNKIYIVDAFTNEVFKGNPAGVCYKILQWKIICLKLHSLLKKKMDID